MRSSFRGLRYGAAAVFAAFLFSLLAVGVQPASAATDPLINEFVADHTGSDINAFIEIFGDAATNYNSFTLIEIEGDSANPGEIDYVTSLGLTDADGFWQSSEDVENGTITLLLVEGFTGAVGDDLDTNDDGTPDVTPWTRIVDSVATSDGDSGDQTYSNVELTPGYDGVSFQPGGASRIPNGADTDSVSDWVRNDFDLAGIAVGSPEGGEALNTPGAVNALVPVINEFVADHTGSDTDAFIEIYGTASADYSDYTLLEIEGDSANPGEIDYAETLAITDANGFWLSNEDAENGTVTLLLVADFTGAVGDDLDTNDDGTPDVTPWSTLVDGIATTDGDAGDQTYNVVLTPGYDGVSFQPGGASRIPNGVDTNSVSDWVRNDFDLAGISGGSPEGGEAYNTPGATNTLVPVINEFVANHTGSDTNAFIEIFGTASTDYSAFTLLEIEGDSGTTLGEIDYAETLTSTDANGFWLSSKDAENGTVTLLLVEGFSGAVGDDLDTNDDGTPDVTPWSTLVDGIATTDGDAGDQTYNVVLTPGYDGVSFQPGGASRIPNGVDTNSVSDWVRNDFDLAGILTGTPDSGEALNTPGAVNEAVTTTPLTIGTCFDNNETAIHTVQGTGDGGSTGGDFVLEGIVVGDFQPGLDGFYLQEEDADWDGDANTSEGIFVEHGDSFGPDVAEGDVVRVLGTVGEQFGQTQIDITSGDFLDCANTDTASVTALTLPLSNDPSVVYEAVEGMLVEFNQTLTVTDTYNLGRFGEVILSDGQLVIPTETEVPGSTAYTNAVQAIERNQILVDDGTSASNLDPVPYVSTFSPETLRRGDTTNATVTGVMGYGFSNYRLQPTVTPTFDRVDARPAVPNVGGNLTVATFNVLNYFTTIDNSSPVCGPSGDFCRGADSTAELVRQQAKLVDAICEMGVDVLALQELENSDTDAALSTLTAAVNTECSLNYDYIATGYTGTAGSDGGDVITVAYMYDADTVTPTGTTAEIDDATYTSFDGLSRPAVAQAFTHDASGETFITVNNHFKSKGCGGASGADTDQGDGQGCYNATRTQSSNEILTWLGTDPTGTGSDNILILGDLNAYSEEDPIDALTTSGYVHVNAKYIPNGHSYVFFGQQGFLDHILATPQLDGLITGADAWNINADEPRALSFDDDVEDNGGSDPFETVNADTSLYQPDQFRSSDHDPVIVGIEFPAAPPAPASASASYNSGPHTGSLMWDDVSGETAYVIERTKVGANNWIELAVLAADTTTYTDDIVTCDQNYTYRVIARNGIGDSAPTVSNDINTECDVLGDVPGALPAPFMEPWVEDFFQEGLTTGKADCELSADPAAGETFYCPQDFVTRADMAVFILRALNYPNLPHNPTGATPDPFDDVPENLPAPFMEPWVEEFLTLGITQGKGQCDDGSTPGPDELFYCPQDNVTRADMAVFILRALGTPVVEVTPDPFGDVPSELPAPFMEAFVETFFTEGITTGKADCELTADPGPGETFYCPQDNVTRGDMAVFILRAFDSIPDPNDP